jgi:putative hydrolase of the HAD superfamily
MSIRAVVWDVDDTLFDYTGADRAAQSAHLAAEGLSDGHMSVVDALERWRVATEHHWARFSAGEVSFEGQRLDRVRHFLDRELTDAEADDWFRRYQTHYETAWALFPDVLPVLDTLAASHRHAVLSNSSLTVQDHKLRSLGVHDRFEVILCAAELGVSKPEAGAFLAVCEALELPPHKVAYVGDHPEITRRSTGGAPRTQVCSPSGSTDTADRPVVRPSRDGTGSPRSPNSPRSSAPIPVLEPRPPSGNVLPAPPENRPKGQLPGGAH